MFFIFQKEMDKLKSGISNNLLPDAQKECNSDVYHPVLNVEVGGCDLIGIRASTTVQVLWRTLTSFTVMESSTLMMFKGRNGSNDKKKPN